MQLGAGRRSDRFKMGINVLFEIQFEFCDGGIHLLIDGGNIGTELSHFLLGFCEIRVQGSEASFQVLVTGLGHDDDGT